MRKHQIEAQRRFLALCLMFLMMAGAGVMLQGCAGSGLISPTTFNQSVAYADNEIAAVARSTQEQLQAGIITVDQAEKISGHLKEAAENVDQAKRLYRLGDLRTAEGMLNAANQILLELAKKGNPQ